MARGAAAPPGAPLQSLGGAGGQAGRRHQQQGQQGRQAGGTGSRAGRATVSTGGAADGACTDNGLAGLARVRVGQGGQPIRMILIPL